MTIRRPAVTDPAAFHNVQTMCVSQFERTLIVTAQEPAVSLSNYQHGSHQWRQLRED
jgi:hypothetical protein